MLIMSAFCRFRYKKTLKASVLPKIIRIFATIITAMTRQIQKGNMKKIVKTATLVLTGVLLMTAYGKKVQTGATGQSGDSLAQGVEKVEVKAVEGRKNFTNKAVITPLPAIMIATWDENGNPDVMMAAWGGQCGPRNFSPSFSILPRTNTASWVRRLAKPGALERL